MVDILMQDNAFTVLYIRSCQTAADPGKAYVRVDEVVTLRICLLNYTLLSNLYNSMIIHVRLHEH